MTCNDILLTKEKNTIEITDQQKVVELDSDKGKIVIADNQNVIELKEDTNVIEVAVFTASLGGFRDVFTPTSGQTVFTLSNIPNALQVLISLVIINTATLALTADYTIAGSQLTITLPYALNSSDIVTVIY